MDFSYTEEQQMLRDSLSRNLQNNYDFEVRQTLVRSDAAFSDDVWKSFAEMGLLALPFPEDVGGLGGSIADITAIGELFGEHLVIEPYCETILLAGQALAAGGDAGQSWLDKIISGEAIAAFAHEEGKGTPDPARVALTAKKSAEGFILSGEKRLVINGAEADILVVTARVSGDVGSKDGLVLLAVDPTTKGIAMQPFDTLDGKRAAHLVFENLNVPGDHLLIADDYEKISGILNLATIGLCAEAVGAMGALLRITSEYAATRQQFGQPIGGFQVIAHRLADMKIAYTKARASLLYTTALAQAGRASPRDISILKGQIGKLGRSIGEAAIQTHGGVGMTDELNVGHYHKRLLAIDAMLGSGEYHLRKVGQGV